MQINSLQDLYNQKLELIVDAEQQALRAYPQLLKEVQDDQLREALQTHMHESQQQLQQVQSLEQGGRGGQQQTCASMQALIQEAQKMLGQIQDPDTKDAFVVGAAQAMEHHEISAYGTACAWAKQLGRQQDAETLDNILEQEKQTDEKLTRLAERQVNQQAAQSDREVPMNAQNESGRSQQRAQTSRSSSNSSSGGSDKRTKRSNDDSLSA